MGAPFARRISRPRRVTLSLPPGLLTRTANRCSPRCWRGRAGDRRGRRADAAVDLRRARPQRRTGPVHRVLDVVLGDRSPGGGWSSSPSVVGAGYAVWSARLAVNPSGAAVAIWNPFGTQTVYANYRAGRRRQVDATWNGGAERVIVRRWVSTTRVGCCCCSATSATDKAPPAQGYAVAAPRPERGDSRNASPEEERLAVGAGGAAMLAYSSELRSPPPPPRTTAATIPAPDKCAGRADAQSLFTHDGCRHRAAGAPVRQPAVTDTWSGGFVDMDAKGRALLAWWDGTDLMVRWSRPDGEWRKPSSSQQASRGRFGRTPTRSRGEPTRRCARGVGASRVPAPGGATVGPLQARRTGVDKAGEADAGGQPPGTYTVALGDRGHAAIASDHAQRPPDSNPRTSPRP